MWESFKDTCALLVMMAGLFGIMTVLELALRP